MPEWAGVVNTTASHYLKGASDSTIRERITLAWMMKRKRISFGWDGKDVTQQIKFSLPEMEAYGGGTLDFEPADKYRQQVLDWRGYKVTDTMTEKERLENRNAPRLVNRYGKIMGDMRQSLEDGFGAEMYIDGNASGNDNRIHGYESFLASTTEVVADICGDPNDTYGGLSTNPGAVAGTWSTNLSTPPNAAVGTDWPTGSGDPEYDFYSPRLYNWSSNNWGTSAVTWLDNCERVIRRANLLSRLTHGPRGRADLCIIDESMLFDYLNAQSAKQRIVVPHKEAEDLGFEAVRQEGIAILTEFDVPVNTGYLINVDKMQLRCLYDQLFMPRGPEYDIRNDAYLFAMGFFGNLWCNPKFFSKLYNYAAA
jgi:hypothetical protein